MQFTYDSDMFVKTFESEFTWLNGFMRKNSCYGPCPQHKVDIYRIKHSCK